jgi:hypothetical protein
LQISKSKQKDNIFTKKNNNTASKYNNQNLSTNNNLFHLQQAMGNQALQHIIKSNQIQTKLRVSQQDDPYEREADKMAEQVMRMSSAESVYLPLKTADGKKINRTCKNCEKEDKESEELKEIKIISKKEKNDSSFLDFNISVNSEKKINDIVSKKGAPLDTSTRKFMESRFGYDFGGVRIHSNEKASESANQLNALAFTLGENIVFGKGEYQPSSISGRKLLAHELTHTIQNNSSKIKNESSEKNISKSIIYRKNDLHKLHINEVIYRQEKPTRPIVNLDARAVNIIQYAKDPKNGSEEERAIETIRMIINTYYPAQSSNVSKISYKQNLKGLEVETPSKPPGPNFKGEIIVGKQFLDSVSNEQYFGHRVLTVGHELVHINQYKMGMIGQGASAAPIKHEREFLAFYWEAKTPVFGGTGRVSPAARRNMIDCALLNFFCLDDSRRQKYDEKRKELKTDREEMDKRAIKLGHPSKPEPLKCDKDQINSRC